MKYVIYPEHALPESIMRKETRERKIIQEGKLEKLRQDLRKS